MLLGAMKKLIDSRPLAGHFSAISGFIFLFFIFSKHPDLEALGGLV